MVERARVCGGKYIGNISNDACHPPPCPPANSRESVGLWLHLKNMSSCTPTLLAEFRDLESRHRPHSLGCRYVHLAARIASAWRPAFTFTSICPPGLIRH